MSEVKRFMPVINDKPYKPYAYCTENEDGIYVRLSDYAELKAQRDALAAENAALKEYLKECSVVQGEGNWNSAAEKSVYVPAIDWMPPTPATEAYLNSVRAEGVEMVKSHPAISLCSLTHACEEIAAQLLAGKDGE